MIATTDNREVGQRYRAAGKMSPRAAGGPARRERKSVMARTPAREPEVLTSRPAWRDSVVFAVKPVHSAIFLGLAAGILRIFYPDATGHIPGGLGHSPPPHWVPRFITGIAGAAFLVSLSTGGIE